MYSTQGARLRGGAAVSRGAADGGRAPWGARALAALVDLLVLVPFAILNELVQAHKDSSGLYSGTADGAAVASMLLAAMAIAALVWNVVVKQGRTGQTIGKEALKIKLVQEGTGQPIGGALAFLRHIARVGADKQLRTVVAKA